MEKKTHELIERKFLEKYIHVFRRSMHEECYAVWKWDTQLNGCEISEVQRKTEYSKSFYGKTDFLQKNENQTTYKSLISKVLC